MNQPTAAGPGTTMRGRIFFWAVTSALAGFLFGFDTVVISGAEQKIQTLWGLSPGLHGFAIASALYGTVLGSLFGGWPTNKFGRRATLLWIGVLYVISALGCGFAGDGNGACENLKRAIDLEPRNRILARQDPEFSALASQFPGLRALLVADPSGVY